MSTKCPKIAQTSPFNYFFTPPLSSLSLSLSHSLSPSYFFHYSFSSPKLRTDGSFYSNWQQCVTTNLETNLTNITIMNCSFNKQRNDTVLRIAWDGNKALEGCTECCMQWFVTINDEECVDSGPVDASIHQDLTAGRLSVQFDTHWPGTITGICQGTTGWGKAGSWNVQDWSECGRVS